MKATRQYENSKRSRAQYRGSQKQVTREELSQDYFTAMAMVDLNNHPQVKRGYAVLAGLISSSLSELEK